MSTEAPNAASSGSTLTGERKVVTLLFVDLSGYTRMTATQDPEDVQRAVRPLLTDLLAISDAHGGYVPAVQGDGFMAVFGAPTAHADDPQRALDTAVAMRVAAAAARANAPTTPEIHIGIATGEVLVSIDGATHAVLGAAVNLASRLSDAAAPSEILVDEDTASLAGPRATLGVTRTLSVKGFPGAVRVAPLTSVGPRLPQPHAAYVGRAEERRRLDALLQQVRDTGGSRLLVVTGDPGAGKSSLVETWSSEHPDALVLHGCCRAYGSAMPLSALSEALTAGVGAAADATTAAASALGLAEPAPLAAFVALLPRDRREGREGREPDAALGVAARRLLDELAQTRTVIVLLDDLQWADPPLLEVLSGLTTDPLPRPLLVLGTARDEVPGLPAWPLPPLQQQDAAAVVQARVGAPPEDALLSLLMERSGGNPLWLVECLRLLSERGQLVVEGDRAIVRDVADTVEVPTSIRLLVSARIDRLAPETKLAVQQASVWPGQLPTAAWAGSATQLSELVRLGVLSEGRDGSIRFTHGLVREAVYGSLPRAARVAAHERLLATEADPAVHAYAALEVQRLDVGPDPYRRHAIAERALLAVLDHARHLRRSHTRAARDVLHAGLELIDTVDVVAPGGCAVLLTELAEVLIDLEDRVRARELSGRAVHLAALSGDPLIAVQAGLALGSSQLGTDMGAVRHEAEAALAADLNDALRGRAWRLLADAHSYDEPAAIIDSLERAHDSFERASDSESAASVARQLAFNLSVAADARFDRWLATAEEGTPPDHISGQADLALVRAIVAGARGDWERAWDEATVAMSRAEQVGMHLTLVNAVCVAVETATAAGRRTALPGLLTRLARLVEGHRPRLRLTALCSAAPAYVLLGRDAEADRCLSESAPLLTSLGPHEATMLAAARGQCAALRGRHAEAALEFGRAEVLATETGGWLYAKGCRLQRLEAQVRGGSRGLTAELQALADELAAVRAHAHAATARRLVDDAES